MRRRKIHNIESLSLSLPPYFSVVIQDKETVGVPTSTTKKVPTSQSWRKEKEPLGDASSVSKKEEQLGSKEKVRKFSPKGETKQLGVILVIQEKERTVGVSTCQSSDKKKGQLGSPVLTCVNQKRTVGVSPSRLGQRKEHF